MSGWAASAVLLALAAFPITSSAATVEVEEQTDPINVAHLSFQASAGESNQLSVAIASEHDGLYELEILDAGAAIMPGSGCSGGGAPDVAAICTMHRPRGPEYAISGKLQVPIAGTEWQATMEVDLGDGDNSFEAGEFSGEYSDRIDMTVFSGSGKDMISTGGGEDRIDPGLGSDEVHSGGGFDLLNATASPDGPDLYDLGAHGEDEVNYARRTEPVMWSGEVAGAPGEDDRLVAVEYVAGGSAGDLLVGGPRHERLEGNGGNDVLRGEGTGDYVLGGPGDDSLYGGDGIDQIIGNSGSDVYDGGADNDIMREHAILGEPGFTPDVGLVPDDSDGDDLAYGGGGMDSIYLGRGADRLLGEDGDDTLSGGPDSDTLSGGLGNDAIAGGNGRDRLLGGRGSDRLFAGRSVGRTQFLEPPEGDEMRDFVDCGPDPDEATASPWDEVHRCETWHTMPPVAIGDVRLNDKQGTAVISAGVRGRGRLIVSGKGVKRVKRSVNPRPGLISLEIGLPIRPRGEALRSLRQRGHLRVGVEIRFRWNGPAFSRHRVVNLVQRR